MQPLGTVHHSTFVSILHSSLVFLQLLHALPRNSLASGYPSLHSFTSNKRWNETLHPPQIFIALDDVKLPAVSSPLAFSRNDIFIDEGEINSPPSFRFETLPKHLSQPVQILLFTRGVLIPVNSNMFSCKADKISIRRFSPYEEGAMGKLSWWVSVSRIHTGSAQDEDLKGNPPR